MATVVHRAREGPGCLMLRELGIAAPGSGGCSSPARPPPPFTQLWAGHEGNRWKEIVVPMQNSLDHADSRLSTNLTEIYVPLCLTRSGSAMVLPFCATVSPVPSSIPSTQPLLGQPQSRQSGGIQETPQNTTRVEAGGLGAPRDQQDRQPCPAFPLQDHAKSRSWGRPWASLIFLFWALSIMKRSPGHSPTVGTCQALLGTVGLGTWGYWWHRTWGNSQQWGKKREEN